ncbi:MAG: type III pantothenate kinase [Acidobacteriota bacterium]
MSTGDRDSGLSKAAASSEGPATLCLDIGNTHIVGGVFVGDTLAVQFRASSSAKPTSDELGVFLRSALRENGIEPDRIDRIALCSVVPDIVHSLRNTCRKYFDLEPFVLEAGVKTGLKIRYRNPLEVGSDRIADAVAAVQQFPNEDLIIVDFGTATTVEAITRDRDYLGGMILPGLRLTMEALEAKTAKLPAVEILEPERIVGRSTSESIQSGLYYGTVGAIRYAIDRITEDEFDGQRPIVISTGGFSSLFRDSQLFDHILPDLLLRGLLRALRMNTI